MNSGPRSVLSALGGELLGIGLAADDALDALEVGLVADRMQIIASASPEPDHQRAMMVLERRTAALCHLGRDAVSHELVTASQYWRKRRSFSGLTNSRSHACPDAQADAAMRASITAGRRHDQRGRVMRQRGLCGAQCALVLAVCKRRRLPPGASYGGAEDQAHPCRSGG